MDKSKCQKKSAFWESMLNKYQQRTSQLQQQHCKMQHHLESVECAMPGFLNALAKKDNQMNQNDIAKLMSQMGKVDFSSNCVCGPIPSNTSGPAASSVLSECPCPTCLAQTHNSHSTNCECCSCLSNSTQTNQQSGDDASCDCNPCPLDASQRSSSTVPKANSTNASCDCSSSCGIGTLSNNAFSLQSCDLEYMKKLQELADREKQMKCQIQEMLHREQAYMETLRQADEMWACMECCYKERLNGGEQSGESERLKYEKLSEQLTEENSKLSGELEDVKLELKHCIERLQGPVSREIDKERRKSKQLENELRNAAEDMATKENTYLKEMNSMQSQLNSTCRNLCHLNAANEELKKEMELMQHKYNQLQQQLIKEKINEGQTLLRMQEMIKGKATGDEPIPEKHIPEELPNNFVTNACLIKQSIKFLHSYKTKCSQTWINGNNPSLNAEYYFKNISFIRAPRFFNATLFKNGFGNCPKNVCIPIEHKICNDNFDNCHTASTIDTSNTNRSFEVSCHLNIKSNHYSCINLVQKIKYNLYHNGTEGLTKIQLFFVLNTLSYYVNEENIEFLQQFEVNYFWSNYTFNYTLLLSGNPGYLISKPVLVGNLITVNKTVNKNTKITYQQIHRNYLDVSDIFLIIPISKKGMCILTNSSNIPIEFGYNMIAKCKIQKMYEIENENLTASNLCKNLQNIIFDYWPVFKSNLSDINRVVGNFGNANGSVLSDWTRILSNKNPQQLLNETLGNFTNNNSTLLCNNLITNLKIDIFHARVDFKDLHNQEKIFGTTYNFGYGQKLRFHINKKKVYFEVIIKEEVMFFDVTSERIQKFVEPPSFKVTLPYDFFYPFVKLGNSGNCIRVCKILIGFSFIFIEMYK